MAVGTNYGQEDTKKLKIQLLLLKTESKSRVLGEKVGYYICPCTHHHQRGGQTTLAAPLT